MVAVSFAVANIVGPQTFQAHDAPQYIPAKVTILVVAALAAVTAFVLRILLGIRNKARNENEAEVEPHAEEILLVDHTDKENKRFRYSY
jgi:phosphotransferase system  glucose/maltose/N-acetylglucosamine-specific IIC component